MHKNTYTKGILTFIMYPTNDGTYVAACKELCLVREGKDEEKVSYDIKAAAQSYIWGVVHNKLSEDFLNQDLPKEIMDDFQTAYIKKNIEKLQRYKISFEDLRQNDFFKSKKDHTLTT